MSPDSGKDALDQGEAGTAEPLGPSGSRARRSGPSRRAAGAPTADGGLRLRAPFDTSLLTGLSDAEIIRTYLGFIRLWRKVPANARVPFRADDLAVLVGILGTDAEEIERRLIHISGCTRSSARLFRRMLLAGVATLPLSMSGAASAAAPGPPIATVRASAQPMSAQSSAAITAPAEAVPTIAAAVTDVPVRTAAMAELPVPAPAATLPDPSVPAPLAAVPNEEATVAIPSLGIDLPVVEGGQEIIDEGVVAHYVATGWRPPVDAGATGTYWLAAHNVTHGGPFERLHQAEVGAEVRVTTKLHTYVYTITSHEVVGVYAGYGPVYGADAGAKSVLLQTCLDSERRLLVHGTLTAVL